MKEFDVIVVGSGHAGVEAGYVSARMGCSVLMVTVNWQHTAFMSCNPSIGGLGKGHIVKEIDILGGLMGRMADKSCIQFKRLNSSKGPAVRGSRAQCDKSYYSSFVQKELEKQKNIKTLSAEVKALIVEKDRCRGVITHKGEKIKAKAVILSAGTFMKGILHIGDQKKEGGREGEKATFGLSDQLKSLGFPVHRLKTGTPPRLKKESIHFSVLQAQQGDKIFEPFSFFSPLKLNLPQVPCYITYTNEKTHDIIRKNLKLSALYAGGIEGMGPRYCPSVEDKIVRFADKPRHLSFLEPETLSGDSIYPQGLSTSLPVDIQKQFLRSLKGLEHVELLKPGYAVEYDFIDPLSLYPTLETKLFKHLFFAGQINGSSGYEEAGGQGLLAGINASAQIKNLPPLVLNRHEAYIGVLIDDLVTKGTKEPYRMMSARAEHRLLLREDNAIERLFALSQKYKLLSGRELLLLEQEIEQRQKLLKFLETTQIVPNEKTKARLQALKAPLINRPMSLKKYLSRPEVDWPKLEAFLFALDPQSQSQSPVAYGQKPLQVHAERNNRQKVATISVPRDPRAVEIAIKYEGYIKRERNFITKNQKWENQKLEVIDYDKVQGLSLEALEKLKQVKPQTLGQASRISGVTPASIQVLLIHLARKNSTVQARLNEKNQIKPNWF